MLGAFTIVRFTQQLNEVTSFRNNRPPVQGGVGAVVVFLDLVHIYCFCHPFHLVYLPTIVKQTLRIRYRTSVTFEIDCVDFVEAKQGHKQPDVGQRESITGDIATA